MKRVCFLEVNVNGPDLKSEHSQLFKGYDYYFISYKELSPISSVPNVYNFGCCPNTNQFFIRNRLYHLVPKIYDYYIFIDHDICLSTLNNKPPLQQMLEELDKYNPAVWQPKNKKEVPSRIITIPTMEPRIWLYGDVHFKAIHHSLLNYFYPCPIHFGGFWDSAIIQYFLEISLMPFVIESSMVYADNIEHGIYTQSKNAQYGIEQSNKAHKWISGFYQGFFQKVLPNWSYEICRTYLDDFISKNNFQPIAMNFDTNYLDLIDVDKNFKPNPATHFSEEYYNEGFYGSYRNSE